MALAVNDAGLRSLADTPPSNSLERFLALLGLLVMEKSASSATSQGQMGC